CGLSPHAPPDFRPVAAFDHDGAGSHAGAHRRADAGFQPYTHGLGVRKQHPQRDACRLDCAPGGPCDRNRCLRQRDRRPDTRQPHALPYSPLADRASEAAGDVHGGGTLHGGKRVRDGLCSLSRRHQGDAGGNCVRPGCCRAVRGRVRVAGPGNHPGHRHRAALHRPLGGVLFPVRGGRAPAQHPPPCDRADARAGRAPVRPSRAPEPGGGDRHLRFRARRVRSALHSTASPDGRTV
ncbi:MAG: hypothetical protein AVDCRST_MAG89-191, partial [uncultured Gemmatimonadetes bacterium]